MSSWQEGHHTSYVNSFNLFQLSSESDMLPEQNEEYGEWKYQTEEIGNEGIGHLLWN